MKRETFKSRPGKSLTVLMVTYKENTPRPSSMKLWIRLLTTLALTRSMKKYWKRTNVVLKKPSQRKK